MDNRMNHFRERTGEHLVKLKEGTNRRFNALSSSAIEGVRNFRIGMLIADPWPFLLLWTIAGIFVLVLPRNQWHDEMDTYYNSYGYAIEYQNAQRAYEEAQKNQNDNNNNNNYNYNGSSSGSSSNCRWFQYNCKRKYYELMQYYNAYYGGDNKDREDEVNVPYWYRFIGGLTEQDRRNQEEQRNQGYSEEASQATAKLRWVYAWMIAMFLCILLHGMYVLVRQRSTIGLRFGLFLYAQFCILSILMIGQGVIQTDNRDLEDSIYGWYGQLGVLMVYTNFWMALFCLVFLVLLQIRACIFYRRNQTMLHNKANDVQPDPIYSSETENNKSAYPYRIHNDNDDFRTNKPIDKGSMA